MLRVGTDLRLPQLGVLVRQINAPNRTTPSRSRTDRRETMLTSGRRRSTILLTVITLMTISKPVPSMAMQRSWHPHLVVRNPPSGVVEKRPSRTTSATWRHQSSCTLILMATLRMESMWLASPARAASKWRTNCYTTSITHVSARTTLQTSSRRVDTKISPSSTWIRRGGCLRCHTSRRAIFQRPISSTWLTLRALTWLVPWPLMERATSVITRQRVKLRTTSIRLSQTTVAIRLGFHSTAVCPRLTSAQTRSSRQATASLKIRLPTSRHSLTRLMPNTSQSRSRRKFAPSSTRGNRSEVRFTRTSPCLSRGSQRRRKNS